VSDEEKNVFNLDIQMYTEAMKYSPLNLKLGEGETMAMAAANRSKIILPVFVFSTIK